MVYCGHNGAIKSGDVNPEMLHSFQIKKSGINDHRVTNFCTFYYISAQMQLRAKKGSNTLSSPVTLVWLNFHFKLMCDFEVQVPNAMEDLHFEPVI